MMPTVQRNDIARLKALIVAGAIPVPMLTEIEIRHTDDCLLPIRRSASCTCAVRVFIAGTEVTEQSPIAVNA